MNKERLELAIQALEEYTNPHEFTMLVYTSLCGTPSCVLGHLAARQDLQNQFYLDNTGAVIDRSDPLLYPRHIASQFFDISVGDAHELFGCHGCGEAKTPEEAIAYIRGFIQRRAIDTDPEVDDNGAHE